MKFYAFLFSFTLLSFVVKAQVSCISGADFTFSDTCSNMPTSFFAKGGTGTGQDPFLTYKWDFNDPASGAANIAFGQNPRHTFTQPVALNTPVTYNVRLTIAGPNACADTIFKLVNIYKTPLTVDIQDVLICGPTALTATGTGTTYLWSDGQTGNPITVKEAGRYWVKTGTSVDGCTAADTAKVSVWGQGNKGDYNWNFGNNSGLNFSSNPPTVITSGTSFSAGTSSISTPSGKLLFYTDGKSIYNNTNTPMANGNGTVGTASTDNVLIVPDPRSNNAYYVFTSGSTGLTYSVVDMSYNSGAGQVIETNVKLNPYAAKIGILGGVSDSAGAFYVASYDTSIAQLVSYKIDNNGIIATPVISSAGFSILPPNEGTLKFSTDGKKASIAVPNMNIVEVYDFNRVTGVFSNPVQITVTTPSAVEFSPDNSKLFVGTDGDHNLYQYDLAALATPPLVISNDPAVSFDDLHLAPDGRIFAALGSSGSIGIINNPNLSGAATQYIKQSGIITTNMSLPNIVADYFTNKSWAIAYQDTCTNSPTLFQFTAPDSVRNWTWYFDGVPDPQVSPPGSQTTQHTFTTAGSHAIRLIVNHHCGQKDTTISITTVDPPIVNLPANTTVCVAGDSVKLDATNPTSTYVWSPNGETTPFIYVKSNGTYSVVVTNQAGCTAGGSTIVNFINQPKPNLGKDTTLCFGQTTTLNPGSYPTASSISWSGAGSGNTPSIIASASGIYRVDVNFTGCSIKDTIKVTVLPQLSVNLGSNDTLCIGANKTLQNAFSNPVGTKHEWYTLASPAILSTANSYSANTSADYILLDSIDHCFAADTVNVKFVTTPSVTTLGPDKTFCVNSFIMIDAGNAGVPGVSYLWSPNGETVQKPTVSSGLQGPTTYSVVVTIGKGGASGGCSASGSVTYTYVVPPVINLGPDRTYCQGQSTVLDADPLNNHPAFTYLWNPGGQNSSKITASTTGTYKVQAKQGFCTSAVESVVLTFNPVPAVSLPAQYTFCKTKDLTVNLALSGANPNYNYTWSTGEISDVITVSQEGTYFVSVFINGGNCPADLSTNVISICEPHLNVPTAFSPNGDGINEIFQIYGEDIEQYDFRIFDRWGELIFVSTDLSQSWDGRYKGKIVEEGVYIWKVEYFGKSLNGLSKHSIDGDVTVIK